MQLAIAARCITQSAFRFRERRRIKNDQVILGGGFLSAAQEYENILFNPTNVDRVERCVLFSSRDIVYIFFYRSDIGRARASTGESKSALVCKTIKHAPAGREA